MIDWFEELFTRCADQAERGAFVERLVYACTPRIPAGAGDEPPGMVAKGPSAAVFSLGFSPDGKRLAAGSQDDRVYGWDVTSGTPDQWAAPSPWRAPLSGPAG